MKIIILGNQSRAVYNFWSVLARTLIGRGHTVVFALPKSCSDDEEKAQKHLVELGGEIRFYSLSRKGLNPFSDCKTFLDLYRLFVREKPNFLFSSTIKPVIYGCLAAKCAHIPHIYATITGLGYTFEKDSFFKCCIHFLASKLYYISLRGIEGVFFQNADDVAEFRASHSIDTHARILMARGTGVDTKRFQYTPLPAMQGKCVFLLVGRLLEAKGIVEYVEAAKRVRKKYPWACFQLLGPFEEGLGAIPKKTVEEWVSQGFIEYLGVTDDVRPYLAGAHIVVLPSWREGTPTAIMEAMSVGRACIVTDAPGCREVVVNGVNGLLVPCRQEESLARAMERLIEDPALVCAMGGESRKLAETVFDAEIVADKILQDMGI